MPLRNEGISMGMYLSSNVEDRSRAPRSNSCKQMLESMKSESNSRYYG